MTHLGADTARGTACGNRGLGDRVTLKRQQCTCSNCLMNVPAHEAYLKTLDAPGWAAVCAAKAEADAAAE